MEKVNDVDDVLLNDIQHLIHQTKSRVFRTVHSELVMLYWYIGRRIQTEILKNDRAEYGQAIIVKLAEQLSLQFGKGFSRFSLSRMVSFYKLFPNEKIVATLSQQLGWSHFVTLLPLDSSLKVEFYSELCRLERWSVRTLRDKIQGMLFERTDLAMFL